MGYFISPGGGDANEPTYPSSPITFDGTTSTQTFNLTNSGTTPASVELSFSSLSGGQTLLIGQNYDQGTDTSPTYVIDPDTGTRTVTLSRGALSPSSPSSSEVVTLTSNAGVLPQTITCTVQPLSFFDSSVRDIATPTYESVFEDASNSGSVGGSFTTSAFTITASSEQASFKGYGIPGTNGRLQRATTATSAWGRASGTTRTWIYAWTNTATLNNVLLVMDNIFAAVDGPGHMQATSEPIKFINPTFTCNTSHSHSISGSSEALSRTTNTMNILAVTWDGSGSNKYRWKQAGHGLGFSYGSASVPSETASDRPWNIVGWNQSGSIKWRYAAIIDSDITDAQFQTLTETAGL